MGVLLLLLVFWAGLFGAETEERELKGEVVFGRCKSRWRSSDLMDFTA